MGFGSEETETKKLNLSIEITNPENRPLVSDKAPCDFKYVQGYALEYLWCGEKQEDETYTYGSRLNHPVNQVEEAIKRYIEEQRDRQVTMVIRRPEDINKYDDKHKKSEPPCLSLNRHRNPRQPDAPHLLLPQLGRVSEGYQPTSRVSSFSMKLLSRKLTSEATCR